MSETTLLNSPDKELLDEIVETTEDTVSYYLSISEKLVKAYTEDFDELMLVVGWRLSLSFIRSKAAFSSFESVSGI